MKQEKRLNQANKAYSEIRKQLIARNLEPGTRLTETDWADKLEVNRADVKQAMARLQGEGLLQSGAKGGFFVKDFSEAELRELFEIRIILESAAAKLAINNATSDEIEELYKIVGLMENLMENNLVLGFKEADLLFHETFVKSAHNKRLFELYQLSNLPISGPFGITSLNANIDENDKHKHRDLVDMLKTKNVDMLIKLIEQQFTE